MPSLSNDQWQEALVQIANAGLTISNANPNGQNTMANSSSVAIASDQSNVPVKAGFTEIAGQAAANVTGTSTDLIPSTDVSAYKEFSLQLTGTWTMTLLVQGSNDNANFVTVSVATPGNAGSSVSSISSNGIYNGYIGFHYLRVRPSAWTSNASCVGTLELYTQATTMQTVAITGSAVLTAGTSTIGNVGLAPATSGGLSDFHVVSAASNNATNIKASAGQLFGYEITNTNAAVRYVKFYNKASAPAPATDTVFRTVQVPASGKTSLHIANGLAMGTGISFATVTGASDTDNTAISAGDLIIDIDWK